MFKQGDSTNRQIDRKWTVASYACFNKFYVKMSVGFFFLKHQTLFLRGFILKSK